MKDTVPLLRVAALAIYLLASTEARGGRPLTTEDASVIPAGKGQLEMSWDFVAAFGSARNHIFLAVPGFGIGDRVEFDVELPFVLGQQEGEGWAEGIGDVRLTSKVLLYPERGPLPGFAVQAYFKLDTGKASEGLGTGEREAGFFGIVSKQIGDFSLHGMLGLDFSASGPSRGHQDVIYGVAVDYEVGKLGGRSFHLVSEVFGNTNINPAISFNPATWLFGATYEISEAWTLDCGVAVGLADSDPDLNTTVGATFLFP